MSDHDPAPDPVDKAYAQAETALSDEADRAARRARVLAAVAEERAASKASPLFGGWRPDWRRDRWLAAACVAGFGLFLTVQFYRPMVRPQPPAPATTAQHAEPRAAFASKPTVPAAKQPASRATPRLEAPVAPSPPPAAAPVPPRELPAAEPQMKAAPAPQAFPATADDVAVTGARARSAARRDLASGAVQEAQTAKPEEEFAKPAPPPPPPPAPSASDLVAKLIAAASAGRTAEVEALLANGVAVDAVDAEGDTALMRSIQADRPEVAALLHRRGASLDVKNHAGRSARDMASAARDAKLKKALGLKP